MKHRAQYDSEVLRQSRLQQLFASGSGVFKQNFRIGHLVAQSSWSVGFSFHYGVAMPELNFWVGGLG